MWTVKKLNLHYVRVGLRTLPIVYAMPEVLVPDLPPAILDPCSTVGEAPGAPENGSF